MKYPVEHRHKFQQFGDAPFEPDSAHLPKYRDQSGSQKPSKRNPSTGKKSDLEGVELLPRRARTTHQLAEYPADFPLAHPNHLHLRTLYPQRIT